MPEAVEGPENDREENLGLLLSIEHIENPYYYFRIKLNGSCFNTLISEVGRLPIAQFYNHICYIYRRRMHIIYDDISLSLYIQDICKTAGDDSFHPLTKLHLFYLEDPNLLADE